MRRIFIVALVALLLGALAPLSRSGPGVLQIVRVKVSSPDDAAFLLGRFDETHNHGGGYVELLLWPGDAAKLAAAGYDYEVVVGDVLARDLAAFADDGPVPPIPGPDRTDYRRLPDYVAEMKSLAKKNPSLVRLMKLPHESLEGRPVYGLEIAAGVKGLDGRPFFYVDGIHHAREWPAAEYPMIFAHHLVERFGRDARITNLLKDVRVIVVPIVNVDGFDYSRESLVQNSLLGAGNGFEGYWRKNRRSFTGATVPAAQKNPDAYGVDPNRNYGFLWGDDVGGSSGFFFDQTYRGEKAFSEPETRNVRDLILSRHVTGLITNHTYGRLVLRPWGHTASDSPDERILDPLGQRLANAMGGYDNIKGIGLYATTGTTDDWSYAATAGLGYTFEHGTAFHPAYSTVAAEAPGVIEAFTIMAEAAAKPNWHSVIEGRVVDASGHPVKARLAIFKSFRMPLWDGNPSGRERIRHRLLTESATDGSGRFEWHVNPSTRPTVVEKGKKETYMLAIYSGGRGNETGGRLWMKKIVVRRGQRLDLGTIRLEEAMFGSSSATATLEARP